VLFDYNEIMPGRLWVGSLLCPQDAKQLRRMGITMVISLQSDQDLKSRGINLKKLVQSLEEFDVDMVRLPIQDFSEEAVAGQLSDTVAKLEAALAPGWSKIYLHCTAGINRSPTVAAAYLMKSLGWTALQAYDYIVEKRECQPYLAVLEKYGEKLAAGGTLER
jgi:protein-tyrosine phosphatase